MSVIARDVYEIAVRGGEEAARQLAQINARLDETRRKAFEAGRAFDGMEASVASATQAAAESARGLAALDRAVDALVRHLEAERRALVAVDTAQGTAARSAGTLAAETREVSTTSRSVVSSLGQTATALLSIDAALNLAARGWNLLRRASGPLTLAASFETEIAAIDTISNRAGTRFAENFLDISERLGIDAAQVARAGYEAVGSGVAEAILPQFTEIAGRLATAGRTEIQPTLSLLTTLQNQYGLTVEGVARASDILFATTKVGVTTIEQLAAELGAIIPTAKGAGFSLEEVNAAVAALTKGGLTTAEATTQIRSLAVSLSTDIPKVTAALNAAGVGIGEAGFRALSFTDKVRLLYNTFANDQGPLIKAFGRIEGVSGALALGANNAGFLTEALDEIARSAGATDGAFRRMEGTTAQTAKRLRETFNRQLIELGTTILPTVNNLLVDLTTYLKENGDELAAKIKDGVDTLISLGQWVAENGQAILTFFGGLVAAKVVTGIGSLVTGIGAITGALGGATAAAGVFRGALAFLTGPIGAVVAGITAIIATVDLLINKLSEIELGRSLESFANGVDLDIRAAQARIQQEQNRRQLSAGQGVLLDPAAAINPVTGQIGVGLAGNIATIQETLAQGIDVANDLVGQNLRALETAIQAQTSRQETALANLEGARADLDAADAEVRRLSLEQARGNLLVQRELVLAVNAQAEARQQVANLEGQAIEARERAAELELTRANLAARFQATARDALLRELQGVGNRLLTGLRGLTPTTPTDPDPRPLGRPVDDGIADELRFEQEAAEAAARLREAALQAEFANAGRRTQLIADTNARDLRLLALRHAQELAQAQQAGEDLGLLLLVQGQQRQELVRSQEDAAAQTRIQAQQDFITQLDRLKQTESLILAGTDEGALIALQNRQEAELALIAGNQEAERALRERHERDMTLLIEQQNAARIQAIASYAEGVGGILSDLAATMRAFGVESKLLAGIEIAATAATLQAKAFSTAAEAGLSFASGNIFKGTAQAIAAAAAQAQAIALYAKAATLGAGGGGGGGARAGGSAAPRRSPRLESSGRDSERAGVTYVFNGPVYDSRRDAEAAFGRQALRGFRRLQDAPRGAPRARVSEFEQ